MSQNIEAHIRNNKGTWALSPFDFTSLSYPVQVLHFVAHTDNVISRPGSILPNNHWSFYLQITQRRSVRIDTLTTAIVDPRPAIIMLQDKQYAYTSRASHVASVPVPEGTTVATVLKIIIDNGRDKYFYNSDGEGCSFWLCTIAHDLARAGLIPQEMATEVQRSMQWYYPTDTNVAKQSRQIPLGAFA